MHIYNLKIMPKIHGYSFGRQIGWSLQRGAFMTAASVCEGAAGRFADSGCPEAN
jgi:hypothetical protein